MPDYSVCGGVLRSEIDFPELRPVRDATPTWRFCVGTGSAPDDPGEPLGEELLYDDVRAVLHRQPRGFRIVVEDTGTYDLSADGRQVVWYPCATAWLDFARAHLIGRVLATTLHLRGFLTLHGSAVAFPSGGLAFIAPKFHGKSTLAYALTRWGAKLLSDDTIPIEATPTAALLHPGVHSLRLHPDSAVRFGRAAPAPTAVTRDGKWRVDDLADAALMASAVPLAAVYVLVPCSHIEGEVTVARRRMNTVEGALVLVRHTKIAAMLGKWGAPALLQRATKLVSIVPVFTLGIVNRFEALDEVTAQIAAWHGASPGSASERAP